MRAIFNKFQDFNVAALGVLAIIFAALLLEGANTAASASLLTMTLLLALAVAAIASRLGELKQVLLSNALSVAAAFAFLLLAIATAWPGLLYTAPPEPHWSVIGEGAFPLSISPYRTWEGAISFLAPCAAYLLGALAAPDRRARDWVGRWVVVLALLYAFIGLYLFFVVATPSGARLDVGVGSANAAAALFGVFILVSGALIVRGARGRLGETIGRDLPSKWAWAAPALTAPLSFATTFVLFACLLLTASRGGLIASLVGFSVFALALWAQGLKQSSLRGGVAITPVVLVIGVFALLFARGGDDVLQRFALAAEDMEIRRALAEAHWAHFLDRPLLGHGLNAYHELNTLAATPENWQALRAPGSAHNILIQVLEETGLIGLTLWAAMLATPMLRAIARIAHGQRGIEWAATAFAAATLVLLHGLVDFALQVPAIAALFAFILGASVGRAERLRSAHGAM